MSDKKNDDNNNNIKNSNFIDNSPNNNIISPIENNEIKEDNKNTISNDIILNINQLNSINYLKKKKEKLKSKQNSFCINQNTLVYSLPCLSNDKSKKNKNYEKILLELKNLFNIWDKTRPYKNMKEIKENNKDNNEDNNKDNNKDNNINHNKDYKDNNKDNNKENNKDDNYNNKNKNYFSRDIDSFKNILDYITIIKKPPNERTMLDLYLIVNCLSNTKLGQYFKEEFDDNKEIFEKLITFCSVEIKHKKFYLGQKIFNIGDLPDNFYIILQGRIDIVKPQQKKTSMTGNQYFCYLMDLIKKGDNYTFNLCIENNTNNYVIEKEETELIPYIFILINLEKINIDYPIDFSDVLKTVNISETQLGLTEEQVCNNDYIRENMGQIKKSIPHKISNDLIEKYYFIFDKSTKNDIIIYDDVKFLSLETNDYFGDSALDCKTTRNATIIASDDTDVGYLEMNLYHTNIGEEKSKLIKKKINFLIKNFFFKRINPKKFEKKYFGYFISNNYKKGDIIYRENEKPLFVYFIEEGKVELSSSKNIFEMEKTIETLDKKRKNINKLIMVDTQKTDSDNEKSNDFIDEEEAFLYNKIKNNCKDLIKHINNNQKNKLFILSRNEDLGIISFYFDYPYITDCVVSSNKAKIFKINIKYLNEIMNYEQKCISDLNKRIKYKIQLFQERFFNINNTKLLIADKKETNKIKERIEYEKYIKHYDLLHKNDIIYNKIKNEKKIDINKFKEFYKNIVNKNPENNNKEHTSKDFRYNKNVIKSILPNIRSEKVIILNNESKSKGKSPYKDWKNQTINHRVLNIQKINNDKDRDKDNSIKLFNFNNKTEKHLYKKGISNFFDKDISYKKNSTIYINNKKMKKSSNYNISDINKSNKNDYFIYYFKKYFGNDSLSSNTPLIFSRKKINNEPNQVQNPNKDKLHSNNKSFKYSNINTNTNSNSNSVIFVEQNNVIKNSRNSNNKNNNNELFNSINNIPSFSKYKKLDNSNDYSSNKNNLVFNNQKVFQDQNKLAYSAIPNINKSIYKNKENNLNSYTDRGGTHYKNFNKNKKINHPYYSPAVLTKREKYKVFNNDLLNKYKKKEKNKSSLNKIGNFKELGIFSFSSEDVINTKFSNKSNEIIKYKKIL